MRTHQQKLRFLSLLLLLCLLLGGCEQAPGSTSGSLLESLGLVQPDEPLSADAFLEEYASYISVKDFGSAYGLLTEEAREETSLTEYAERHTPVFDAIGFTALCLTALELTEEGDGRYAQTVQASYTCDVFGSFTQELVFDLVYDADSEIFRLDWQADDLFDGLEIDYTLRLNTLKPQRGEILDSDHNQYAINTYADTVYLRLSYYDEGDVFPLVELSSLLNMSAEELEEIIYSDRSQTDGIAILKTYPPLSIPEATENALATLEGVGVDRSTYTPIRYYPQGTTMSHAIGYVSPVTAEDMEANPGVYDVSSMVGRSGLEAVYEDTLRGEKGYSLDIYDENGSKVKNVALLPAQDGLDLEIGIDMDLQLRAEELLSTLTTENAGAIVVLDPTTGQVQAISSYPNFNPNYFAFDTDASLVNAYYAEDANNPLYNRATQGLYPPGSTVKPLIAAMALDNDIVSVDDEFPGEIVKNQWTPKSFGDWYYPAITRVSSYEGAVNMSNAITKSDNIYFAWVALKTGWDILEPFLQSIGFGDRIPFDLRVSTSNYMNGSNYNNLRLLSDTGYGQGQMLVSPLQMACVFSTFANDCDIMVPRLVLNTRRLDGIHYDVVDSFESSLWKEDIFSSYARDKIEPMLQRVVTEGSGRNAAIDGLTICGKTGTAEIGSLKEREIAWFIAYLDDADYNRLVCVALETPANWEETLRYDAVRELLMP